MKKETACAGVAAIFILVGAFAGPTYGADDSRIWVATAVSVEGTVEVRRQGDAAWKAIAMDERVFQGDTLRVQRRGRAALRFRNSAVMRLDQETTLTVGEVRGSGSLWAQILAGAAYFFSHAPRSLEIRTPFVNGTIEGTEFAVTVGETEGAVAVFDGRVALVNDHGRLTLGPGESGVAAAGKAPVARMQVSSEDMVQWTVFFPAVLGYRDDDFRDLPAELREAVRTSLVLRRSGNASGSLGALPGDMEAVRDPRVFALRAELRMALGRYAEARADLARAAALNPDSADMLALRSMVSLVGGRREEALLSARKAVESDARSTGARTALSYARQAAGDLDGALDAARGALSLDGSNAMARARVAELLLMQGERLAAVGEAARAVEQSPSSALAHTVLGFAHLAGTDRVAAMDEFGKAVALAPGDPHPRLGLGLAKIRGGDLAGGRAELETAVALDPQQSLLRSYLGKAYAEENRDGLAERELARAKVLDLNDPTPYFYDAMRKQTLNQPVDALADIQESVLLNGNRAVYRSGLLLDRDLAVRGVSQARIYQDLGFSQLAFAEACRSVTLDPGNASAHRFLADAYAGMPRSEIARESELLVAQLRQPHGAGLIQPRLGEARPGVLTALSAVDPAYNEYTRLFERDGARGMASVFAGNQNSWGQELIGGGVFGRYALSAGESRIMSDGWRENADIDERVQNVIASVAVTPELTLLGGYRRSEVREGDTELRFDPLNYSTTLRQEQTRESKWVGGVLTLGPDASLLAVGHRSHLDSLQKDVSLTPVASPEDPESIVLQDVDFSLVAHDIAWDGDLQFVSRTSFGHFVLGVGRYDGAKDTRARAIVPGVGDLFPAVEDLEDITQTTLYTYSHGRPLSGLDLMAGVSAVRSTVADRTDNQINPKLGVLWSVNDHVSLRSACLRTVKRHLVVQETLEPATVNGFDQFYDDPNGSDMWKVGVGVDARAGRKCFFGAAVESDRTDIPLLEDNDGMFGAGEVERKRRWLRSYCYAVPHSRTSLGLEINAMQQDSSNPSAPFAPEVAACWVPLIVRYVSPLGCVLGMRMTRVRETFDVLDPPSGEVEEHSSAFLLADVECMYRLPRRHGMISLEGRNIFDRNMEYQYGNLGLPLLEPGRSVILRLITTF